MKKRIIINSARALLSAGVWAAAVYLLYRYEYFKSFSEIDNVVGAIPVALLLMCAGGFTALMWLKYTKKTAPLAISLAVIVILSAALFPNSLRGNWWIYDGTLNTSGESADITVYEPFTEGNKTVKLEETATLKLEKDLPKLDGALALYPVYSAFAETVYDKAAFDREDCFYFTNTLRAFNAIIAGERDVIFTAASAKSQLAAAKSAGADLCFTPIGKEAFVFIVGDENPVDNLSYQQIRNIYSGKTAKWSTLGWEGGGDIIAYQRPEGSGSQTGLQLIMGDLPLIAPQPLPDKSLRGTNSLMQQVSAKWKGVQPALGYSYKYFASTMYSNPHTKLLKIDGVYPSAENIADGSYPFVAEFYAVTNGKPKGNTKFLIDWILSPQGQEIIEKTGYAPVK